MKKIIIFLILMLPAIIPCKSENFYYAGNEKYSLTLIPNKRAILQTQEYREDELYVKRIGALINIKEGALSTEPVAIYESRTGNISLPVFSVNKGTEVVMLSEIILKTKNPSCDISFFSQKYDLTLAKETEIYQIYSVPIGSDVIGIANTLFETGNFEFAYPNFFCQAHSFAYIPNDEYFQNQITCHNVGQTLPNGHSGTANADINAPEAWDITKGSPDIVIAVFDGGVTSNHPDLPNSRQIRLDGSNFGSGNANDPSPTGNNNHGNACAGVIAATMDNYEGITGIAPNCKIMPLRWDATSSPENMADGINFAVNNGANIISCSWGYSNSGSSPNLHPIITNAIEGAINNNVIVVFAAGNTANHRASNDGHVEFPANASVINLLTIGASDRYDSLANYSPKSPLIDFVAPSHKAYSSQITGETLEMWSIDISGDAGYNPVSSELSWEIPLGTTLPSSGTNHLSYTGFFGGTSHACPVVAGVVALMLSVNPWLTPADVYDILKMTSKKVGGYSYTNGKCNEMGYGCVDAYAAVLEAKSRYIQGPDYVCDTAKYYLLQPSQTGETVTWSVDNGSWIYPHYSIIGSANQDTVYVRCERMTIVPPGPHPDYMNSGNTSFNNPIQSLSVTISNGTTSNSYTKQFRSPTGNRPIISASNSAYYWRPGTTRTFSVSNCTSVPDSALHWEVKRVIIPRIGPNVTTYTYSTGRTMSYQSIAPPAQGICTLDIKATNTLKDCLPNDTTLSFMVRSGVLLNAYDDGDQLQVTISEEDSQDSQQIQDLLKMDGQFTLELWNSVHGRMLSKPARSTNEQMNIAGFPQGVYVLRLKDGGEAIAETKVIIQ